jgi:hypothetical protein
MLSERVAGVAEADAAVAALEGAVTVVEKSVDVGNGTPRVSRRPRTDAREDIPDCGQSDNAWTRALRPDWINQASARVAITMVVALRAETWQLTWEQLARWTRAPVRATAGAARRSVAARPVIEGRRLPDDGVAIPAYTRGTTRQRTGGGSGSIGGDAGGGAPREPSSSRTADTTEPDVGNFFAVPGAPSQRAGRPRPAGPRRWVSWRSRDHGDTPPQGRPERSPATARSPVRPPGLRGAMQPSAMPER